MPKRRVPRPRSRPLSRDQFLTAVNEIRERKTGLAEERNRVNQVFTRVASAGGNKGAMRMSLRLSEMPIEKRHAFLADLQTYCDWLGIWGHEGLFDESMMGANGESEAAADLSIPESADEPGVISEAEIAAAQRAGAEDGRINRSAELCAYPEGTPLREHYDRAWLDARAIELARDPSTKRQRQRPPRADGLPARRGFRQPGRRRKAPAEGSVEHAAS